MNTNTNETNPNFDNALNTFVAGCQAIVNEHFKQLPNLVPEKLEVKKGFRYTKVIANSSDTTPPQRIYCFVETATGDVLKAATWSQPAKGARGNIYAPDNGLTGMTPNGAPYKTTRAKKAKTEAAPAADVVTVDASAPTAEVVAEQTVTA